MFSFGLESGRPWEERPGVFCLVQLMRSISCTYPAESRDLAMRDPINFQRLPLRLIRLRFFGRIYFLRIILARNYLRGIGIDIRLDRNILIRLYRNRFF